MADHPQYQHLDQTKSLRGPLLPLSEVMQPWQGFIALCESTCVDINSFFWQMKSLSPSGSTFMAWVFPDYLLDPVQEENQAADYNNRFLLLRVGEGCGLTVAKVRG